MQHYPPYPTPGPWPPVAPPPPPAPPRRRTGPAIAAIAAGCLIAGGITGALITSSRTPAATAPTTAGTVMPTVPATPDPVCAEWAPLANAAAAKQAEWGKSDPKVPAASWTPEQRALTTNIIPVLKADAADMRRLADKAQDPFLASLFRAEAVYTEAFIDRLPTYQPADYALWQASIDFSTAVRAACTTVASR